MDPDAPPTESPLPTAPAVRSISPDVAGWVRPVAWGPLLWAIAWLALAAALAFHTVRGHV